MHHDPTLGPTSRRARHARLFALHRGLGAQANPPPFREIRVVSAHFARSFQASAIASLTAPTTPVTRR